MKNIKKILTIVLFAAVGIYLLFQLGKDVAEGFKDSSYQEAEAGEEPAPTEEATPTEAPAPTEEATPTEAPAPTEEATPTEAPAPTEAATPTEAPAPAIDENGIYDSKDEVALYIHTFGHLPSNYITKKQAKALGWEGGGLEAYAPGKCIGGDYYGNYEGVLPEGDYHECDIDTLGRSKRGAKRIVYDSDGDIYYTGDHYEHFEQLY